MSTPPLNPTTFLLVRHAQTVWNLEQRHTGNCEVPLAPSAQQQIGRLTKKLLTLPISAIYSSPLTRTLETITPIAEISGLPIEVRTELIERDLGVWEGKLPSDLIPLHPGYHFPESAYNGQFHIPGAEPLEDLERRIRTLLTDLLDLHPEETIALSTHSGVIWTILHRIVTNPPEKFFWPGNCSLSTIERKGNHFNFVRFEEH